MTCTFEKFERRLLEDSEHHPIPYKYVISSPRAVKPEDCYEYLHIFPEDYNRCLCMEPSKRIKPIQGD